MTARAKKEKDSEMMTSGGGATEATNARKPLHVFPALGLGEDLWLCSPPLFLHVLSPLQVAGAQQDDWEILLAREPMTADYGTSRKEAAIMRCLGFGWGIRVLGHTRSRGSCANLSSDPEVLVILTAKMRVLRQQCSMDPACGSASRGSQLFKSRGCVIISPPEVIPLLIKAEPLLPYCLCCSSCREIHSVDCTTSH